MINWSIEAREFYRKDKIARILPEYLWEKKGITWSYICSNIPSFRLLTNDSIFDVGGSSIFCKDDSSINILIGFLNSKFAYALLKIFNPTINYQVSDIRSLPFNREILYNNQIKITTEENIFLSHHLS